MKLAAFVAAVCAVLFGAGLTILVRQPNSDWLAFLFLGTGVLVALACPYYFKVVAPYRALQEKQLHQDEMTSLADLIEWRVLDDEFPWVIGDRIVSRDWSIFLERSALALKS